jgi:hypothetical protein
VARSLHEASSQTVFAAARNNVIGSSFYVHNCCGTYDLYFSDDIFDENKIAVSTIFSMYKTWHTVLQRPERIIPQNGKHQVETISSSETGPNIAVVYVCSKRQPL